MQTILIDPKQSLSFSRIIYGMWRLTDDADTSPAHIQRKIETCLEHGITTFDQADIYGDYQSETTLGACLQQAPQLKQNMHIITKCDIMLTGAAFPARRVKYYDTSAQHICACVDQSLQRMQIERIDMLLLHRPDPLFNPTETGAELDRLVANGKVRTVGVSNFKPYDWDLLQSHMQTPLRTNQIEISLCATSAFTNGGIAHMQRLGLPIQAWSPLAGGDLAQHTALWQTLTNVAERLNGVSPTLLALAWVLKHPACIMPVIGTNKPERIAELAGALQLVPSINREMWFELYTAAIGNDVP